jgi:hydroxymethylglutaryl-CoA reductase
MSTQRPTLISGFSKLSKSGKIRWIVDHFFRDPEAALQELKSFWHPDQKQQEVLDGFSENTVSNYPLPWSVAPNFRINDRFHCVPMVTEESSVVAAASSAAKFWMERGGFRTIVLGTLKKGQVHFLWKGAPERLRALFPDLEHRLRSDAAPHTANMEARGGGVTAIRLLEMTQVENGFYQLDVDLQTCDSMGANFTNTVLESFAQSLTDFIEGHPTLPLEEREVQVVMSILSNYTPQCVVRAEVSCPVEELGGFPGGLDAEQFARKFALAVRIARQDPYRATTHNKGIFNGVDAVVIATGNDFRAVEACGHAFASRDGQYRSLSDCRIEQGMFHFWLDLPLALGTVGGLTALHPIARRSLELLGNPGAEELMQVTAAVGLAQNFAAVRSLVTTGIQHGHMKMHLQNILQVLGASAEEKDSAGAWFADRPVTYQGVREYLQGIRGAAATFAPKS